MALARPLLPAPELSWWGWGDPERVPQLPEAVHELLTDALGVRGPLGRPTDLAGLRLPEPRLTPALVDRLSEVVGSANAGADLEARARHARGKSTPDLLEVRSGGLSSAPDLVLAPSSHDEALALLTICSEERVAVVPFGGGTSVVGGVDASASAGFAGIVALDLRNMNALLELDEDSRLAVLQPGLRGPQAEDLLNARGYTIGHFPQSFEYASLGGFAAARSSGQASAGYGRFDELVLGMKMATPAGTLQLGRAPKSATGPDLRQLLLGSEGALGIITSLTVQLRPTPTQRIYDGWWFQGFEAGTAAIKELVQDGPMPTVVRLSDEVESALNLARPQEVGQSTGSGCLAIVGYEGQRAEVGSRRERASEMLRAAGGTFDEDAGEAWARERFRGPYLRDALLDAGALVETLETVTFWSSISRLYRGVSDALRDSLSAQGTPPVVMCHISHVYPTGASLYFTVACAAGDDPSAQWQAGKNAAGDAILAAGGSISHHHGVGRDHRHWYEQEVGELGIRVLRSMKTTLDPAGIMNPGVLIESPA